MIHSKQEKTKKVFSEVISSTGTAVKRNDGGEIEYCETKKTGYDFCKVESKLQFDFRGSLGGFGII